MLLSIIIPTYHTPFQVLRRLFDSIRAQQRVDWEEVEIVLVNDNEPNRPEYSNKALAPYIWGTTRIINTTGRTSCGGARNAGLDAIKGDWVYFMDADDEFFTPISLWYIMNSIREADAKNQIYINFDFFNEYEDVVHDNFWSALYATALRRDKIEQWGLRFIKSDCYEDCCFITTYLFLTPSEQIKGAFKFPIYLYHDEPTSITKSDHRNNDYLWWDILNIQYSLDKFKKFNTHLENIFCVYSCCRLGWEVEYSKINGYSTREKEVNSLLKIMRPYLTENMDLLDQVAKNCEQSYITKEQILNFVLYKELD